MVVAYIRVSTEMQSYEGQRYEIERWAQAHGICVDRWEQEKVSGTMKVEKRTLGRILKKMKKGDMLLVSELSRLGRNMLIVMSVLNVCSQKGVEIHSIKDNFELSDSLNSRIIAFAFSLAAEIERNLISQRTREALAARKMAGVKLGRPAGKSRKQAEFDEKYAEIMNRLEAGATLSSVSKWLKIHPNTLSRYLKNKQSVQKNEPHG